ncbi:MAG: hypothetical protein ACTS11_13320, partial [Roseicyclus sp.]
MTGIAFSGRVETGHGGLDTGIDGMTVVETDAGAILFVSSGPRGGIVAHDLSGATASVAGLSYFGPGWGGDALAGPVFLSIGGEDHLIVAGSGESGLWTLSPDSFGAAALLSGLAPELGPVRDAAEGTEGRTYLADGFTGGLTVHAWTGTALTQTAAIADTDATYAADVFRLATAEVGPHRYILAASQSEAGVAAFREEPEGLVATGAMGAGEGLGVMIPTAMETVMLGGRHFVVLASAAGNGAGGALSVLELLPSGALVPTDHVTDTLETRFGRVQDVAIATAGGHAYVAAGGGDDGLTLFALLPNGRLHLLESVG